MRSLAQTTVGFRAARRSSSAPYVRGGPAGSGEPLADRGELLGASGLDAGRVVGVSEHEVEMMGAEGDVDGALAVAGRVADAAGGPGIELTVREDNVAYSRFSRRGGWSPRRTEVAKVFGGLRRLESRLRRRPPPRSSGRRMGLDASTPARPP